MPDATRKHFGLTQQRLASWLRINRNTLAQAESYRRAMPVSLNLELRDIRLTLASVGKVPDPAGTVSPGPPPLPVPPPERKPLERRRAYCRHHARRLRHALEKMQGQAVPLEARLAALPSLRAWTGPVSDPAREANWLALFEGEANAGLRDVCGAGPQRLLEARAAGLEREAELLEASLADWFPPTEG